MDEAESAAFRANMQLVASALQARNASSPQHHKRLSESNDGDAKRGNDGENSKRAMMETLPRCREKRQFRDWEWLALLFRDLRRTTAG